MKNFMSSVLAVALTAGTALTASAFAAQAAPVMPGKMIVAEIPRYISVKAPMYFRFLSRPQTEWVRTERAQSLSASSSGGPTPHLRNLTSAERTESASTDGQVR